MLGELVVAAAASFGMSLSVVWAVRRWARSRRVLDHPNDRSLHRDPTPRGGGIGIVLPVCLAVACVAGLLPDARGEALGLLLGGVLVAGIGLADDLRRLPALGRLAVHCLAAALFIACVGLWHRLAWPGLWSLDLHWAATPLTFLWLVGLTNAYNFMDGIDGIAGTQGVVAGLGWAIVGYFTSDPLVAVVGAVLAAASSAFLVFNWSPASIFMGDVGSGFLGFVLAGLPVAAGLRAPEVATAGAVFVWPFVFDATLTFLRRAGRGENVLAAHRSHLYQRLVLSGMSHGTVTLAYGVLAAVGLVAGVALLSAVRPVAGAGLALIALLAVVVLRTVAVRESASRGASTARSGK